MQRQRCQIGLVGETCPSCKGAGQIRLQQGFFSVSRPCGQCEGSGHIITEPCDLPGPSTDIPRRTISVHIQAGIVKPACACVFRTKANMASTAGPAGDLYVAITVKAHPIFQRKGNDIVCDVPINFVTAALGGKIEVPTLKGTTVMKVPPGHAAG